MLDDLGRADLEESRLAAFKRHIDQHPAPIAEKNLVPRVRNAGRSLFGIISADEGHIETGFISQDFEQQGTVPADTGLALIDPISNQYGLVPEFLLKLLGSFQVRIFVMTLPATSVRRKRRPL